MHFVVIFYEFYENVKFMFVYFKIRNDIDELFVW